MLKEDLAVRILEDWGIYGKPNADFGISVEDFAEFIYPKFAEFREIISSAETKDYLDTSLTSCRKLHSNC